MMVPWIKVATDIAHDPKVTRIAKACGVNDAEALGLVVGVLTALPVLAPEGDLSEVSDAKIEGAAAWERKRGQFAAAFRSVWCVDHIVANWDRWNGATLRQFAADRRRKKEWREQQKEAESDGPSTGPSTGRNADAAADRLPLRGKREEGRTTTPTTQAAVDIPSAPAEVLAWVHPLGHAPLAELFAAVPHAATWVGLLRGYASGLAMDGNRPCDPARLAAAVQDFVAAGKHLESGGPSPQLFRGFIKRAKAPEQRHTAQLTEAEYKAEQLRGIREQNERRRRMRQDERPEPVWAGQIDAMFPDGRTQPIGAAA